MKLIKSALLCSMALIGSSHALAKSTPTEQSPDSLRQYVEFDAMPDGKVFGHLLENLANQSHLFSQQDLALLNQAANQRESLMIQEFKQQALIFKKACHQFDGAQFDVKEAQAEIMAKAFEQADKASLELYTKRYQKTLATLSLEAQELIKQQMLPKLSHQGKSSKVNWQALATNDFNKMQTMFDVTCKGFSEFPIDAELELVPTVTKDESLTANGDALSSELKTLQIRVKKDNK